MLKKFKNYIKQSLQEINLSRLWDHTQNRTIGIVSACRGEHTEAENKNRTRKLEMDIRSAGFGFVKLTGYYVENLGKEDEVHVKEYPFLIIAEDSDKAKLKKFIVAVGKKYTQDSVLYKEASKDAHLIGTAAGVWPGLGKEESVGQWHPNRIGMFYSKMKNTKTFTFEEYKNPDSILTMAYSPSK